MFNEKIVNELFGNIHLSFARLVHEDPDTTLEGPVAIIRDPKFDFHILF